MTPPNEPANTVADPPNPLKSRVRKRHKKAFVALLASVVICLSVSFAVVAQRGRQHPIDITISEVRFDSRTATELRNSKQNHLITITTKVTNRTERTMTYSPQLQTRLTDSDDKDYRLASTATSGSAVSKNIEPGKSIDSRLTFEIPRDSSGLIFHFSPSNYDREISIRL